MIDLTTTYLGLPLHSPLVASASPLSEKIETIQRLEAAGAGAVVLYSLFEETLIREQEELHHHLTHGIESFAEAITYFPDPGQLTMSSEHYLEHIQAAKRAVNIPIIASLNGDSLGGWTKFAHQIEQAGADALELNIYAIPTDLNVPGHEVEQTYIEIVKAVRQVISIPIAVKIGPFFSNMGYMAKQLAAVGADGLVLFNRFYQPDIDLEHLEVRPNVLLSTPQALRLPLRWIAILYEQVHLDLAATSGIHQAEDVLKMLMAGANVTMMASALLRNGPDHLKTVEADLREWMESHEYESVNQLRGSMSYLKSGAPQSFERTQYRKAITSYPQHLY
jgi:dihydroorotate dehydrogenase (fumarate)